MEEAEEPAPSLVDLLQATALDRRTLAPDLSLPAATAYLDQLLSLPLKSILSEASGISADAQSVENELTNLCFREYPTFISVHKCSAAVTSAFDDFSDSLGRLLDAVPALEDECRTFVKGTTGVQNARGKAALVQEHQDKLFDLLEIPQLMDTCVRNGYYQEALELSAHTTSLLKRYPDIEIIQDISKEVDGVVQVMLAQLLSLLRESIKLPALVKTVGYLRRLEAMEESELCLAFLISRLSNFRNHIGNLERDRADPVRYVRKYIDLFREHVFDIISQFTTIFLEGTRSPVPASQLASFVGQCVNDLVKLVGDYIPKMASDAAALSSILVQLGYCALAFARVGLDFAPLITAPFSDAVLLSFTSTVEGASTTLGKSLTQAERAHGSPSQALVAQDYVQTLVSNDSPLGLISWDGNIEALPADLARFPPLALLVNSHLSALNSLRLLAPLHLYPALVSAQADALLSSTHRIAQYVRQAAASTDPSSLASGGRPEHHRTNSGRAHLIRRNSETQLTPEARASKQKETQWACIAFADTWVKIVVPLLFAALDDGVFAGAEGDADRTKLQESLHTLQTWIDSQRQQETPLSPATVSPTKEQAKRSSMFVNGKTLLPHAEDEEVVAEPEVVDEPEGVEPERESALDVEAEESALDREVEAVLASASLESPGEQLPAAGESTLEPVEQSDDLVAVAQPLAPAVETSTPVDLEPVSQPLPTSSDSISKPDDELAAAEEATPPPETTPTPPPTDEVITLAPETEPVPEASDVYPASAETKLVDDTPVEVDSEAEISQVEDSIPLVIDAEAAEATPAQPHDTAHEPLAPSPPIEEQAAEQPQPIPEEPAQTSQAQGDMTKPTSSTASVPVPEPVTPHVDASTPTTSSNDQETGDLDPVPDVSAVQPAEHAETAGTGTGTGTEIVADTESPAAPEPPSVPIAQAVATSTAVDDEASASVASTEASRPPSPSPGAPASGKKKNKKKKKGKK